MSLEAGIPGEKYTWETWQMICCRYYIAAQFVAGKQVLEVGCGTGRGLGYLAARAKRVVGGDYAEDNLRYAREHYKERAEILVLDAQKLPFKDNSFDVAVAMEVIYYLTCLDDFFKECHRVLRKGGILCFCLSNKDVPGFHASPLSHRYYSVPELFNLLNQHNFDAELFGAFPVLRGPTWEHIRATAIVTAGKVLDKMPKGRKVREFLSKIILGRTVVGKPELDDSDMIAENYQQVPVPSDSPDFRHRILYAIAHAR